VVQEQVEHGAGQGAIVVEDFGPGFIGLVGDQQDANLLTPGPLLQREGENAGGFPFDEPERAFAALERFLKISVDIY